MNKILEQILKATLELVALMNQIKLRLPLAPLTRDNCGSNFVCNSDSFISSLEVDDIVFTDKDGDKYTTTQQFDHSLIINQLSEGDVARTADEAIVHTPADRQRPDPQIDTKAVHDDVIEWTDEELYLIGNRIESEVAARRDEDIANEDAQNFKNRYAVTDVQQALRNLRDGALIPDSPHPAYALIDRTLDHIEHLEEKARRMKKSRDQWRKGKRESNKKAVAYREEVDSLKQRIRGYEADLDGSTRMITAFRKAFNEVSSTVDKVMPNGGLGDDNSGEDVPF
jgi:hypothetical protein